MTDIRLGETLDLKFTTVNSSGVPATLSGTPSIAAYPDNDTVELTAGITLTVDFDARTGLNNVRVVATGANGYAAGSIYSLVIVVGTVDGNSVVGYTVGEFSIERNSAVETLLSTLIDGVSVRDHIKRLAATNYGKTTNDGKTFRDVNDTRDAVVATIAGKNRTAVNYND